MAENLDNQKEWKNYIDEELRIDSKVREIKEALKPITLFQGMKFEKLSERYFKEVLMLDEEFSHLISKYHKCKSRIENSGSKYKDESLKYLEEKFDSQREIIFAIGEFYDKRSRENALKAVRMKNGEEADFLSITGIPQIEEKYKNRRNELSRSKKNKYLKFTGRKLDFLQEEITRGIHCLLYVKREIISYFAEIHLCTSHAVSIYNIRKSLDTYEDLALLINEKYNKIISKKDFSKSVIYFSERECLDMEEICELIEKAYSIRLQIIRNFESIIFDKTYIMIEFGLNVNDEEEAYNKLFGERIAQIPQVLDEFSDYTDEPTLQSHLIWDFNIKNRESMLGRATIKKGSI